MDDLVCVGLAAAFFASSLWLVKRMGVRSR
jgi:hypothetical protein